MDVWVVLKPVQPHSGSRRQIYMRKYLLNTITCNLCPSTSSPESGDKDFMQGETAKTVIHTLFDVYFLKFLVLLIRNLWTAGTPRIR